MEPHIFKRNHTFFREPPVFPHYLCGSDVIVYCNWILLSLSVVIFLAHGKPQWETCLEWQYKVMHQTDILVPIMLTPVVHTNYHPSTEFDTTPCHANECETMTDQNLFSPFPSPPAVRLGLNKIQCDPLFRWIPTISPCSFGVVTEVNQYLTIILLDKYVEGVFSIAFP